MEYRTGFEPVYQCFADIVVKPLRQRYIKEEINLLYSTFQAHLIILSEQLNVS